MAFKKVTKSHQNGISHFGGFYLFGKPRLLLSLQKSEHTLIKVLCLLISCMTQSGIDKQFAAGNLRFHINRKPVHLRTDQLPRQ